MTPVAIDLDGTLIHGDVFAGALKRFLLGNPLRVVLFGWWLRKGRAYAKARVEAAAPTNAATLVYNGPLVAWLRDERGKGRRLALATASDQAAARAVADHVGLFDDVFASDGKTNLKSARKAARLRQAYPDGFVYAGNETADLKVWAAASAAILVNTPPPLAAIAKQRFTIERTF